MADDEDRFDTVSAPPQRLPARTALRLVVAGCVTMAVGAALLMVTVGLFDNSLDRANERSSRDGELEAEVSAGETSFVDLDGPRVWELFGLVDPAGNDPIVPEDVAMPAVRITDSNGTVVPLLSGGTTTRRFEGDVVGVSLGRFRTTATGTSEVQVAPSTGDVASVGIATGAMPDLGDVGGAAGTFLATAAAG